MFSSRTAVSSPSASYKTPICRQISPSEHKTVSKRGQDALAERRNRDWQGSSVAVGIVGLFRASPLDPNIASARACPDAQAGVYRRAPEKLYPYAQTGVSGFRTNAIQTTFDHMKLSLTILEFLGLLSVQRCYSTTSALNSWNEVVQAHVRQPCCLSKPWTSQDLETNKKDLPMRKLRVAKSMCS